MECGFCGTPILEGIVVPSSLATQDVAIGIGALIAVGVMLTIAFKTRRYKWVKSTILVR
jgi:hypothetical protein